MTGVKILPKQMHFVNHKPEKKNDLAIKIWPKDISELNSGLFIDRLIMI